MQTVLTALNQGLHNTFAVDPDVYLIGEDLLDPYGGAFKVSKGLSTTYPDRVLTTPISEHAITNFAVGMALQGKKPIVEIMFGDFITLTMDPMINTLPKLTHMYADQKPLPILIRTPMGAGRGYGPTHSQSLEKFVTAIQGIHTYAPTKFLDPSSFIQALILEETTPSFLVEHKLQYLLRLPTEEEKSDYRFTQHPHNQPFAPIIELKLAGAPAPQLTLISYGYHADIASELVKELAYEYEIFTNLLIFTQLTPYLTPTQLKSLPIAPNTLLFEESLGPNTWSSQMHFQLTQANLNTQIHLQTSTGTIIPASLTQEQAILLNKTKIKQKIVQITK
jgi:pyruvate/2-oxoglutarate/acetoin dehydrogenase E1 component